MKELVKKLDAILEDLNPKYTRAFEPALLRGNLERLTQVVKDIAESIIYEVKWRKENDSRSN